MRPRSLHDTQLGAVASLAWVSLRGVFMNHLREVEHPPASLLQAASSREGSRVGLQPHAAFPLSSPASFARILCHT